MNCTNCENCKENIDVNGITHRYCVKHNAVIIYAEGSCEEIIEKLQEG